MDYVQLKRLEMSFIFNLEAHGQRPKPSAGSYYAVHIYKGLDHAHG